MWINKKIIMDKSLFKLPPQDIEIEKVVLGAILSESKVINKIINYFKSEIFYKSEHVIIKYEMFGVKITSKTLIRTSSSNKVIAAVVNRAI